MDSKPAICLFCRRELNAYPDDTVATNWRMPGHNKVVHAETGMQISEDQLDFRNHFQRIVPCLGSHKLV